MIFLIGGVPWVFFFFLSMEKCAMGQKNTEFKHPVGVAVREATECVCVI